MDGTVTEPPEHTACRSTTPAERRGVEGRLGRWRVGESNPWNVYRGNRHAGVFFDAEHARELQAALAALNGDPDRDEQLRVEGRRQANNAIDWNTTCVGCADRLDNLIAERATGAVDALREAIKIVELAGPDSGLESLRNLLAKHAESHEERWNPIPEGAGVASGLPGASERVDAFACPKCGQRLGICRDCGHPAMCGDSWCDGCVPDAT